jgi:hypothetical protein
VIKEKTYCKVLSVVKEEFMEVVCGVGYYYNRFDGIYAVLREARGSVVG